MSLSSVIFIAIGVIFALLLIMFPEFRILLKGFIRVFIKDTAATPEGARAIYEQKIDEMRDAYNKADDAYKKASGNLITKQGDLAQLERKLEKAEKDCEALVKAEKYDEAELKAEERAITLNEIESCKKLIEAYQKATDEAEFLHETCEKELRRLMNEKNNVVENMKTKEQLKDIYNSMDELKAVTASDKLLQAVKEKNKDLTVEVEGAKVVHDNKLSTKLEKVEKEAKKASEQNYINELKAKYKK